MVAVTAEKGIGKSEIHSASEKMAGILHHDSLRWVQRYGTLSTMTTKHRREWRHGDRGGDDGIVWGRTCPNAIGASPLWR